MTYIERADPNISGARRGVGWVVGRVKGGGGTVLIGVIYVALHYHSSSTKFKQVCNYFPSVLYSI